MSKTISVEKHDPLKTCPMCGGKADYNWDEVGPNAERHWYIHCAPDDSFKGCISHDGRFATLREAVTHWNTRKADCHEELGREAVIEKMAQIMCDQELRRCMKFSMEQIYEERERTWRRHIKEAGDLLEAFEGNGISLFARATNHQESGEKK